VREAERPEALVVVGRVGEVRALDRHAYAAELAVERVLAGARPAGDAAPLRIAWEELAPSRPARFAAGERVLVALAPAADSIWRGRLEGAEARVVAGGGDAFDRDPGVAGVDALAAYLALAPELRGGEPAAAALAAIAAAASAPVAEGALDRLDALADPVLPASASRLAAVLADAARPEAIRRRVARLAGARGLEALRPALETLLADADAPSALRADALVALSALPGGAPEGARARALAGEDAELRAAAVRAEPPLPAERLASLAARDLAPGVRAAALERLAALPAPVASGPTLAALEDPDPRVRETAIRAAGALGEAGVPALYERAIGADVDRARAPLAALAFAGPAGRSALERVALEHRDERVRALARVLLGQQPFPGH
jgi:hypothetical protein